MDKHSEKATFGAGCFWGIQATLQQVKGIKSTSVGYMGGNLVNPTYEDVCTNTTGHAEVIDIEYDPSQISYEQLLDIFWNIHDPTTLNRQGPDTGTQYRSVIFYYNEDQKAAAIKAKNNLQQWGKYRDPIVTEIVPASEFYRAEEYHQNYFKKHELFQQ